MVYFLWLISDFVTHFWDPLPAAGPWVLPGDGYIPKTLRIIFGSIMVSLIKVRPVEGVNKKNGLLNMIHILSQNFANN